MISATEEGVYALDANGQVWFLHKYDFVNAKPNWIKANMTEQPGN